MAQQLVVSPGTPVRTYDRRMLGTVQQVRDGRLLLNPRLRQPYWLPEVLVRCADAECVTLHIDSSVVERYRQPYVAPHRGRMALLRVPLMCTGLAAALFAMLAAL